MFLCRQPPGVRFVLMNSNVREQTATADGQDAGRPGGRSQWYISSTNPAQRAAAECLLSGRCVCACVRICQCVC